MFFKNLLVYRLSGDQPLNAETLETALRQKPSRPCGSRQANSYGFVAPLGEGEDAPLVHAANGFLMVKTQHEERILPSSVVKDAVKEKVDTIEEEQARKVYKKEKDQIKDEVIQTLMPRAFVKKSHLHAAIDTTNGLIYVDAASSRKAEELLSAMREVLGSLPVRPVSVKLSPAATFTQWIKTQETPAGLFLLDECELRDTAEDGGIVRIKRDDLAGEEVRTHLDAGKQIVELGLAWEDKLSFVLDSKMTIKRLRFDDLLKEEAHQDAGEDAASLFDADFVIMMRTLQQLILKLLEALGGEEATHRTSR